MLLPHGKETGLEANILMEPQVTSHVERRDDSRDRLFLCLCSLQNLQLGEKLCCLET